MHFWICLLILVIVILTKNVISKLELQKKFIPNQYLTKYERKSLLYSPGYLWRTKNNTFFSPEIIELHYSSVAYRKAYCKFNVAVGSQKEVFNTFILKSIGHVYVSCIRYFSPVEKIPIQVLSFIYNIFYKLSSYICGGGIIILADFIQFFPNM